ncbi:MAG: Ig-like domain-containing protein [Synechococcales bacterium]|nr:Ig-like domain-containing protein [Synechococcales bacterium]
MPSTPVLQPLSGVHSRQNRQIAGNVIMAAGRSPTRRTTSQTLVVIDGQLADYRHLAAGVLPAMHQLILDPQADGIAQITAALQQHCPIRQLHLVSHGAPGTLYLGNTRLDWATLPHYAPQLKQWFSPSPGEPAPSLLLYGCQVAATPNGRAFLSQLQSLTGTTIYASSTRIGHHTLDGNWDLDVCLDVKYQQALHNAALPPGQPPSLAFHPATLTQYTSVLAPTVSTITPVVNAIDAATGSSIVLTFDEAINPATVTNQTLVVQSRQRGAIAGTVATLNNTITFTPDESFQFGELIEVTVTSGIQNTLGEAATPINHSFRVETLPGPGTFSNSGEAFRNTTDTADTGLVNGKKIALGDLDGDGDLDALVASDESGNRIYLNTNGQFIESSVFLGTGDSRDVALGDVDGDGDLDAVIVNDDSGSAVYLNQGDGTFGSGTALASGTRNRGVALGDLDGDGDLDAFVARRQASNLVYLNNGSGSFANSGQLLGDGSSEEGVDIALGDLDGDGDLDAIVAENGRDTNLWINQGGTQGGTAGIFSKGATLINVSAPAIALGDLDGDGDLDLVLVTASGDGDHIWFNEGGIFTESSQTNNGQGFEFDTNGRQDVVLGDVDGDGDLDVVTASANTSRIWLNDGNGLFTSNGQSPGSQTNSGIALGDMNSDGDLDIFTVHASGARLFENRVVPIHVDSTTGDGAYGIGQTITITVTFSDTVIVSTAGGTPTLTLETGSVDGTAVYVGGSGTSTLTFEYTIAAGENSSDLNYGSSSALSLNGATITDSSGDSVDLGLPIPGQLGSLANNRAIVVDTTNDAPSLGSDTLNAIDEDTTNPSGEAITALFDGPFNGFSDPDPNPSMSGLAIAGNFANAATEGTWQYSTDNGSAWHNVGTVSNSSALVLANTATTLLRFVPVAEYSGTPGQLSVRALDNTYDQGFTSGASRVVINASVNGGTTAIAATPSTLTITVNAVNDAPIVSLQNTTTTLPENTSTATSTKVADIVVTDDDLGTNALNLSGSDEAFFEIRNGNELHLRAGVSLDFETKQQYQVTVEVDDATLGTSFDNSVNLTLNISDVNEAPSVSLQNVTSTLAEDADTTTSTKVADILITDDLLGSESLNLIGEDADLFTILNGTELHLRAGVSLDFESQDQYRVTVTVDDTTVGASPDDSVDLTLNLTDVNEAPTIALQNLTNALSENTSTSAAIKVADIVITDDALGTNVLELTGSDAALFEILNNELYLKAGATLDFETKSQYQVVVNVDDSTVGNSPDDSIGFTLNLSDVNEAPSITLQNPSLSLAENTGTTTSVKVADILITDDALGSESLTLTGADAGSFIILNGTELHLRSGVSLDFETKNQYQVIVNVEDSELAPSPDDAAGFTLTLTDVNEAPTVALENVTTSLAENTPNIAGIKVADIAITDDALGTANLSLSGADEALFEIRNGTELYLIAGETLDFEVKNQYQVTVAVDDPDIGSTVDHSTALTLNITDVNEAPALSLQGTITSLAENTDTTSSVKVADIVIADDALGTEVLTLSGSDAIFFDILNGDELHLRAGVSLDFETKTQYQVTVNVNDGTVGSDPDDSETLAIAITDVNEAPSLTLQNITNSLAEDADTSASTRVADILITDDALGTNTLALVGTDAAFFEIVNGSELHLKAGVTLDFETKNQYQVSVTVNDATVGASPDDSEPLTLTLTDVNDAPSLTNNAFLGFVQADSPNPGGRAIAPLFSSLFADPDSGSSLSGILVVGNSATTEGEWQYSLDGNNWSAIGTVDDSTNALALSASTQIRFLPAAGYEGTPPSLTVRALDNTYTGGFTTASTRQTTDASVNGGTTAIAATPRAITADVITAPEIIDISLPANDIYRAGEFLDFTVTFSKPVVINAGTGTVGLALTLDTGGTVAATLMGTGATSTTHTFRYVVQSGNLDGDGITVGGALSLTGNATIKDPDTDNDAILTLSAGDTSGIQIDTIAPTAIVDSTATSPINGEVAVTVTFSEAVNGFDTSDLSFTNGTLVANSFSGSGDTYSFTVRPTSDGEMRVSLAGAIAQDAAGNGNTASNVLTLTADLTAPTVTLSSVATSPINGPVVINVAFSEGVNGFDASDLSLTNGTLVANSFSGSGDTYSFTVTPDSDGEITVSLAGAIAQDAAGNDNTASNLLALTADLTAPTVTLNTAATSPINGTVVIDVTFSEVVTGFDASDVILTNGTVVTNSFSGSGNTYSFSVMPTADGEMTVSLAGAIAQDLAGNSTTASNVITLTADLTAPSVTLGSSVTSPINDAVTVSVTFSEGVNGFDATDITLTNGTLVANSFSGSGDTYSFSVRPTSDGEMTVSLAGAIAQDIANNGNTPSNTLSFDADLTGPAVTLSTQAGDRLNATFTVTATFDEVVTGFDGGDISITNGTLQNFAGSGTTYTFDVVLNGEGEILVSIDDGMAQDLAGNANAASNLLSRIADLTAPAVTLSSTAPDTVRGSFAVTATFDEAVVGFGAGDVTVTNGSIQNFAGSGTTYTFEVVPASDGEVAVSLGSGIAQDQAGNGTLASNLLTRSADLAPPSVVLTSGAPALVNGSFTVTATFSEAIANFELADLDITNGVAENLSGAGTTYTFAVTPSVNGPVTVNLAANRVDDLAGNGNLAASPLSRTADLTAPTVVLATSAATTINSAFTVTATFSEPVTGFELTDITVGNGTARNGSFLGNVYTFEVVPATDGEVTVAIAPAVTQDAAGNSNTAAAPLTRTADLSGPVLTLTSSAPATVEGTFSVTASFNEAIQGFDVTDLVVSNAELSNFVQSGNSYTVDVTPLEDGDVVVSVAAQAATDLVGNPSRAAQLSRNAVLPAPSVTLSSTAPDQVNGAIAVTAQFSRTVVGFTATDLTVVNGTVQNFTGSGRRYTFEILPSSDGEVIVEVGEAIAQDLAGNNNLASNQLSWLADITPPSLTLTTDAPSIVTGSFVVTAIASEPIQGFEATDVILRNGTISGFSQSGLTYTFTVNPIQEGAIAVSVGAGALTDQLGNPNQSTPRLSRFADINPPRVTIHPLTTSDALPQLTGTISEADAKVTVTLAGRTYQAINHRDGTWTLPRGFISTPLADGRYDVVVTGTDTLGRQGRDATTHELLIDTTAPTTFSFNVVGAIAVNGIYRLNQHSPLLTGVADPGSRLEVFAGSTPIGTTTADFQGNWTLATTGLTTDGFYTLNLVATDNLGNRSAAPATLSLQIDTAAPSADIEQVNQPLRDRGLDRLEIQFTEVVSNFDLSDFQLVRDGVLLPLDGASLTSIDGQTWTLGNLATFTGASGRYSLTLVAQNLTDVTDLSGIVLSGVNVVNWEVGRTGTALPDFSFKGGRKGDRFTASAITSRLKGGKGNDTFRGSDRNDRMAGKGGHDKFLGRAGRDRINGGGGNDQAFGQDGNDRLLGRSGTDLLDGGAGNDQLNGGSSDDILVGGTGSDSLTGGDGRDTFVYQSLEEGGDRLTDFNVAEDLLDLREILSAPAFAADNPYAQFVQFIRFTEVGTGTEVGIVQGSQTISLGILEGVAVQTLSAANVILA